MDQNRTDLSDDIIIPKYFYPDRLKNHDNGYRFKQQTIPKEVWEDFRKLYSQCGIVKNSYICLVSFWGNGVLEKLMKSLNQLDREVFSLNEKPDEIFGWIFHHAQLAWFMRRTYGSPWELRYNNNLANAPKYHRVKEQELLEYCCNKLLKYSYLVLLLL